MSGNVVLEELAHFEQWHPGVCVNCFALHATRVQTGRLHIAAMNRKEMNATGAEILLTLSGPSFGTAGTHEFEFGLSTHPWDLANMPSGL